MAKKQVQEEVVEQEVEATETQPEQVVELSSEQQAIQDALNADDHIHALTVLKTAEGTSDKLATIIATFLALTNALGAEAPATVHALANLQSYKPEVGKKAKSAKGPKEPKEPKFNEVAELKKALAAEDDSEVRALLNNDKVSDALKVVITTYFTLAELEGIEQVVVDNAKIALVNYGRKSGRAAPTTAEDFNVEYAGNTYKTLSGAIYAAGYTKELVGEKRQRECDIAWRAARGKILKAAIGESIESDGKTYTKVAPTDSAIATERSNKKVVDSTEVKAEAEADYE